MMNGTASVLPFCSRIAIFVSIMPSLRSSINALASSSGIPASDVALSNVSSLDGCFSCSKYCEYRAGKCQHPGGDQGSVGAPTIDEFICSLWPLPFLEMLYDAMAVKRVCDRAMEREIDTDTHPVSLHQSFIYLHFILGVAITRLAIPCIFVFAFLGCFGIQLVW